MFQTFRRFFSITLLLIFCPEIFAKSINDDQQELSAQQLNDEHELFQHLMTQARHQSQTIGWSTQQLFQTINAGKIKLTPDQKGEVEQELENIQDFTNMLLEKLFVQTNKEALYNGILINFVMLEYLIDVISKDITKIKCSAISELLAKRMQNPISQEKILRFAKINEANIDKLINVADNIGLNWYHHCWRSLKRHNAYSMIKGVGIAAVTGTVIAMAVCACTQIFDSPWLEKWFGAYPEKVAGESGFQIHARNQSGEKAYDTNDRAIHKSLKIEDQTTIQKMIVIMKSFEGIGFLATSAMVTLDYKNLFSWMYKDAAQWANETASKKIHDYDQALQGTSKPNIGANGYEKVYFKDMVGSEELETLAKKIANFMKHPERYERAQIEEHRGILLYGPPQTGKTLFAKALRTLIDEELGPDKQIHFIDAKNLYDVNGWSIEYIFWYASFYAPCILFFDEIDLLGTNRDKQPENTGQLLTCMQGIDASKQIIVIGATNRPEQLDKSLLVDGRFGKIIHIEYPKYQDRKTFLEKQLAKRAIHLDPEYIDYIAQETDSCSYNNLKRIITEAIILSSIETRQVRQSDFEKTLDFEVRHIQPAQTMSEIERKIVAIYQAGKALARHLLKTKQEVVKITINPVIKNVKSSDVGLVIDSKSEKTSENNKLSDSNKDSRVKLGEVFTKSLANHDDLLSNSEKEQECLALLAGNAALKLIMNETFSQCNKHDRAEVMNIIYSMISQGEKIDTAVKNQALNIKDAYEEKVFKLLSENIELLEKIITKLIEQTTIDRYEWKELIS